MLLKLVSELESHNLIKELRNPNFVLENKSFCNLTEATKNFGIIQDPYAYSRLTTTDYRTCKFIDILTDKPTNIQTY